MSLCRWLPVAKEVRGIRCPWTALLTLFASLTPHSHHPNSPSPEVMSYSGMCGKLNKVSVCENETETGRRVSSLCSPWWLKFGDSSVTRFLSDKKTDTQHFGWLNIPGYFAENYLPKHAVTWSCFSLSIEHTLVQAQHLSPENVKCSKSKTFLMLASSANTSGKFHNWPQMNNHSEKLGALQILCCKTSQHRA